MVRDNGRVIERCLEAVKIYGNSPKKFIITIVINMEKRIIILG